MSLKIVLENRGKYQDRQISKNTDWQESVNPQSELGHADTDKQGMAAGRDRQGQKHPKNSEFIHPQQRNKNSQSKNGRTDGTCGLPGTTATQSLQPCSFSSPMSGRTWTATLTQQSSPCSMVIVPTDDHTISDHFLSLCLSQCKQHQEQGGQ